jgi:hypothetical protein
MTPNHEDESNNEFQKLIKHSTFDLDLFSALEQGIKGQEQRDLNIIEFANEVVTGFDKGLFLSQKVILKSIYSIPLDDTIVDEKFEMTEKQLMDSWVADRKTNWVDPETLLVKKNQQIAELNLSLDPKKQLAPLEAWRFQELIIEAGMRSSKTTMAALMTAYEFYRLIKTDNPQELFGLPKTSLLFFTVMATTAGQGENTVYGNVKSMIQNSNFFKEEEKAGRLIVGAESMKYPSKNIIISLGHSRAASIVGRSAPIVVFDEIAMFGLDDTAAVNVSEIYARVGRSAATFGDKAKRITISSAKVKGDFMEVLVRDNWDRIEQGTLVFSLSTFDVNPMMNMQNPIISGDYHRDIEQAQRDYENLRPGSISGFLNPTVIKQCISHEPMKYCQYETEQETVTVDGEDRTYINLVLNGIKRPDSAAVMYAHADPGVRKDSFGLVIGHPEYSKDGVVTVIDLVLEWIPQKAGKGIVYEVNLDDVESRIVELNKEFRFVHLTFDQWESHGAIQRLFRAGIPTFKQQFAKNNQLQMYKALRQRMKDGLVKIPNHPTLIEELENLELRNGSRVDHPKNKDSQVVGRGKISKDLADGLAMVNWIISIKERGYDRDSGFANTPDQSGNFIKTIGRTRAADLGQGWR